MPQKHAEIFRYTKRHTESFGAAKRQTTACQAIESQTDGMRMHKKASQGVLRARKGTLRVTEWQMGSAGGTKRPKEGFGAKWKARRGSWAAPKGTQRNTVRPEMHTGARAERHMEAYGAP